MRNRPILAVAVLALFVFGTPRAAADIITTTGAMVAIPAPASFLEGDLESSTAIVVLDEGTKFLPITVTLDVAGPGTYDASPGTPSFLAAGTIVHTYFVHFDPVGAAFSSATGAVFFEPDEMIVGIQILSPSLDMSQVPPIPHPTPLYPAGSPTRGFEFLPGTDTVTISPDLGSASFSFFAELSVDQARIFTVAVPEPAALSIAAPCAIVMLCIAARHVRRRR